MKFPKYKQIVNLIPGGCPQFLDFGLDTEPLRREARLFREETATEAQGQGRYPHYLRCLVDEDPDNPGMLVDMREARGTRDPRSGMQLPQTFAEDYDVRLLDSLECFKGEWLPLPFLRVTGQTWPDGMPRVERGPANWARGMLLPTDDDPAVWHLVVAFDTKIEDKPQGIDRYFAQEDLNAASEFILAWHVRDNSWFVNEGWIDEWIHERWQAWDSGRRRFGDAEEDTSCLKHLACYMAWLDCVRRAVGGLRAKVTDPNRSDSIDVDLILDIGNSRTTGIMVETSQAKKTDLNDSYLLELRDLSNPNKSYSDPFETRVEFVDVSFGNDLLAPIPYLGEENVIGTDPEIAPEARRWDLPPDMVFHLRVRPKDVSALSEQFALSPGKHARTLMVPYPNAGNGRREMLMTTTRDSYRPYSIELRQEAQSRPRKMPSKVVPMLSRIVMLPLVVIPDYFADIALLLWALSWPG